MNRPYNICYNYYVFCRDASIMRPSVCFICVYARNDKIFGPFV